MMAPLPLALDPAGPRALEPELSPLLMRQARHPGLAALEAAPTPQRDGGGVLARLLVGYPLDVLDDGPSHLVEVARLAERDHLALGRRTLWHATIVAERSAGRQGVGMSQPVSHAKPSH